MRQAFICSLIFVWTFAIYRFIYPEPRTWYDHYMYQARSFLHGRVDIPNLPEYFQDKILVDDKIYVPFPPMPAIFLTPITKAFPDITQQEVSIVVGALNAVLVFLLVSKFTNRSTALLVSMFFSFGTVAFWSAIVGTTWYFAHNVAFMFLAASIISFKNKWDLLAGIFFSLAVLSRYPTFMGIIFFTLELYKDRKRLVKFLIGALLCIPFQLVYDYLRFGNILETGYVKVYKDYVSSSYPYTIMQLIAPGTPYFGYLDPRNVPLHLFTFLILPPIVTQSLQISPSPYGLGILFTSPLLFLTLRPNLINTLERNLFLGASAIALIDFMHYMQGWVQFGYRFVMDFMPFLIILLALKFKPKRSHIILFFISLIVSTWGTLQGIKLGW